MSFAKGSLDGKGTVAKDPVGYDPIPFPARGDRPPISMLGVEVNQPSYDGTQNDRIPADPILMAPPTAMGGTPIAPVSGPADGAGSIGSDIDGWHPAQNGG